MTYRGAGGVGRGRTAVESEKAGNGLASEGGATLALFWEQLRVRIRTGEPRRHSVMVA